MLGPFSVLRQRHLRLLWIGQLLSSFGDRFFEIATVWLSVQIVGSEAGFVLAAGSIARLVMGLPGGVYADRWDRQKTMIVVDICRALCVLSLPIAAYVGEITLIQLAIVAAITGGLSSIFDPALQASLPNLAGSTQELQAGNALLDVTSRMARIFAPGMAGLMIAVLPIEQFFTLDALTFGISAVALWGIGRNFQWQPEPSANSSVGVRGFVDDIRGAAALVHKNKPVFWSLMSYVPANIVWSGVVMVGLALLADGALDVGVQGYSFLITAYGVGSVLSNIVIGSITVQNRARLLFAGVVVFGLGILALGLSNSYNMALAAMFLASLGTPMSDLMIVLMIQKEFPTEQVGKVYSLRLTISSLGYSFGLMLAAWLFNQIPVSNGIVFYGMLALVVGVMGFLRFGVSTSS